MNDEYDVVGLGTVLVDHLVVVPDFPSEDTKTDVVSHRFQVGGPVPTALAMLTRLDRRYAFIGKWSHDDSGRRIERDLIATQIDISRSIVTAGSTGFAHVWLDQKTGSRTVAAWRGDFAPISTTELPDPFPRCRVLHLDGWASKAAVAAVRQVKESYDATIVLDTGSPKIGIESLIPLVDVLNCPQRFVEQFDHLPPGCDEATAARELLAMGPRTVVITHGRDGAVAYTESGKLTQSAFRVNSVDTTGAGDVFCGAMIYGTLSEWPLPKCLEFAAATAALKCAAMGNRDALPSLEQIQQRIQGGC